MMRLEAEMGQTGAYDGRRMPNVRAIKEEELFDCDVFVFCASKGVPPLGRRGDMRMAQLEANASLISSVGKRAGEYGSGSKGEGGGECDAGVSGMMLALVVAFLLRRKA